MTKPAAIEADFTDFRQVKSRSIMQLVFEVPIEAGPDVLAALGWPTPAVQLRVGIARLHPAEPSQATEKSAERRRFETLPVGQQAAMRCQEATFRVWVRETFFDATTTPLDVGDVAGWLRKRFSVSSRSELCPAEWRAFDDRYLAWKAREAA